MVYVDHLSAELSGIFETGFGTRYVQTDRYPDTTQPRLGNDRLNHRCQRCTDCVRSAIPAAELRNYVCNKWRAEPVSHTVLPTLPGLGKVTFAVADRKLTSVGVVALFGHLGSGTLALLRPLPPFSELFASVFSSSGFERTIPNGYS